MSFIGCTSFEVHHWLLSFSRSSPRVILFLDLVWKIGCANHLIPLDARLAGYRRERLKGRRMRNRMRNDREEGGNFVILIKVPNCRSYILSIILFFPKWPGDTKISIYKINKRKSCLFWAQNEESSFCVTPKLLLHRAIIQNLVM